MSEILVTGGAGFIGSHLVDALLLDGHDVVVFDDFSGAVQRVPKGADFVRGSVTDQVSVGLLFRSHRIRGVFHLAAFAAEGISHAVKHLNYNVNVLGSANVLNACIQHDIEFLAFSSSVAVYGSAETPMREDTVPQPVDSYGNAKLAVERELAITMELQGLKYFALRLHNVYGEWQDMSDPYRNAVAIFLNQILRSEPLTVYGDGGQRRAFTYVADVVDAFRSAANRIECRGRAINVGSSSPVSVLQLAHAVRIAMGVPNHPILHLPARHEVRDAYTDNGLCHELLGSMPETALSDGLAKTAEWARTRGAVRIGSSVKLKVDPGDGHSWVRHVEERIRRAVP